MKVTLTCIHIGFNLILGYNALIIEMWIRLLLISFINILILFGRQTNRPADALYWKLAYIRTLSSTISCDALKSRQKDRSRRKKWYDLIYELLFSSFDLDTSFL